MTLSATKTDIRLRECPRTFEPFAVPMPEAGEVHVWHASLDMPRPGLDAKAILSSDERERMARFRFRKDQSNFLFGRSMLRILLASYLGTSPAELRFAYSAHGKPSLAAPDGNLKFNLSHSKGIVLFAFSLLGKVGVDVECIRHDLNVQEIAGRFFSAAEKLALVQHSNAYDAFFHCWTRKEAFVKARGEGLSCPLESFDVSVAPEDEEVSLATRPDPLEAQRWHLSSMNFFPGYAAAVAVESEPRRGV